MELIMVNFALCRSRKIEFFQKDFQNGGPVDMRINLQSHIRIQDSRAENIRVLSWKQVFVHVLALLFFPYLGEITDFRHVENGLTTRGWNRLE